MIFYDNYYEHMKNYNGIVFKVKKERYNFFPSGFDIETYTQYQKDSDGKVFEHYTNMYVWQFQLGNDTYIGRTWKDFHVFIQSLKKVFTNDILKFVSFICNQSFEFAFMGRELEEMGHAVEVFARKNRKPMKIIIDKKIVFLDTYLLTGYSLEVMAKNYTVTQKLVGEVDYSVPRNEKTDINDILNYCVNDVKILAEYSQIYAEKFLKYGKMPMTKTMIANQVVKNKIKELNCQKEVFFLMQNAYPKSQKEYDYLMSFYCGAFTHGMLCNLFDVHNDCLSYDVTSEYPYVMMDRYYPMTRFKEINVTLFDNSQIQNFLDKYCCLLECELKNYKSTTGVTIISKNRHYGCVNATWDNGRLYSADSVKVRITEIDLQTLKLHADFEIKIEKLSIAKRGYLPKYFRLSIAELYYKKSTLKGKKDCIIEYNESKQELNGLYGACCTKLTCEEIFFQKGWNVKDKENDFSKLWKSKDKLPQWSIYITSHSRNLILSTIHKIIKPSKNLDKRENFFYSDTDSIKCKNKPYIVNLFNSINSEIIKNNQKWIDELNLKELYSDCDFSKMGTFDFEGHIERLKVLGSKRYLIEKDNGEIEPTIAGLPKKSYIDYCKNNNIDAFDAFSEKGILIADSETYKLCAYYEDEKRTFNVIDKDGNSCVNTTQSYVSLIPIKFSLEVTDELQCLHNKIRMLKFFDENKESN